MKRGEVRWYTFKAPDKRRPVLILTRESAIGLLASVTVAPITTTVRGIPAELLLTDADGLPQTCAANFDNLQTVPKQNLGPRIATLSAEKMQLAGRAIAFALEVDG